MFRAIALIALGLSSQALAQEPNPFDRFDIPWGDDTPEFAWENEHGYYWIYERDVRRQNGEVTAWVRERRFEPASNGTIRSLTRMTFDCKGRYRYSAQTSYGDDDRIIQEIDRESGWTFIRPETGYDTYQQALCP